MTAPAPDNRGLLVHAYLDGELDPAHAIEIEREIASDPLLAAERARIEALRKVIGEKLPRETAPPELARRIQRAIGPARTEFRGMRFPRQAPSWLALAASVLFAIVLASGATWLTLRPTPADAMTDMVLASHIRSLMAPQPTDVESSDRHTVKPWFNGRVAEAPRVIDLADQGFPLVGGRIDVIGRTSVPTLVYRTRQHLISLFEIPVPGEASRGPTRRSIAGYNLSSWVQDGVLYWAVSDVAAGDLDTFGKAFRDAPA